MKKGKNIIVGSFGMLLLIGLLAPMSYAATGGMKGAYLDTPSYDNALRFVNGEHTYAECTFMDNFGRKLPGYLWNSWNGVRCQPFTSRGGGSASASGSDTSTPDIVVEEPPVEDEEDDDEDKEDCDRERRHRPRRQHDRQRWWRDA